MKATPQELTKYAERSHEYAVMANFIQGNAAAYIKDPQVRALAGTFAAECRELAKRWAGEKEGGL